ncbi:right-handed parallel beta-helix repeat-containing protein, partial [Candidatus Micrarchaeota archaeon]|nr:right-handed parallel beta-helix repeat-containing protein [Candidatus Micrarchaeota archaeon]
APNPVPSGGYACVVISASDVALDCNGYTITGNNSPAGITYGVYARGPYSNITIENCFVSSYFEASVFLHEVSDSFIINNTAYNTSFHFGFWFNQSFQDNIVENNTAYDNEAYGFYVFRDCDRNNFTGNTAYNNSWSTEFLFGGCDYNRVVNNTAPFGTGGTSGFKLDTSPYNTFIGNNVSNRGREGFENYNSRNGTFINNTVVNCQGAGFEATGTSDYLTFTNNTVQGTSTFNSASGFDIRTDHVLLEDNTVHGQPANLNSFSGSFYFNSADDIVMTNNHVYNSTPALRYAAFNGPYILNVTNLIVDNPLGNFQNYTNLSYNDSHTAVGVANYLINWSDGPGSLPTDYISFENKHVNITPVTNNISLDRIVWHWNDAELPGYNESEFELWKHNGSWSDTGATLNTGANTLSLTNMNPASEYSILERDVEELSNCPIITAPGTYTMTSDFAGAPNSASELGPSRLACVKIASSDVVFDCAGHTIHESSVSDSFYTYGVLVNGSNSQGVLRTNVTVQNCVIAEYYQGVHLRNSRTTSVINNTIANSTGPGTIHYGIQSFSTNWTGANEVTNYYAHNTITNIGAYGISSFGSGNSTFYNNTISLFNSYGISASDHLHNITDNLVRDGGNGYSAGFNIQSENATVHNNTAYNISGDGFNAGAGRDYNNFTSNHAYNNSDDGFDFSGIHGYLLEENLAHDNGGNGFYIWTMVGGSYSNISNNTAENNTLNGFHLNFEPYNTLEDNYAFNNSLNGFLLNASKYNNLTSNIALNNSQSGFMLTDDFLWGSYNTSEYNRLIDNNASGNGVAGLSVISSNHNYVDPSYFCNNTNGLIVFNSTNVTLFDNVLCNNTDYGLNMTQSNVTLSENQMYNNGHDLFVEGDTNYNMSGSLFLNPLGTLVDYTNLSINDSLAASTSYTINWTTNSSTLPTDYNSFEEKFVNISTVTGTSSIGSLAWHWTDTEAGSYDESKLQVWKWNGSWSNTGAILNAGANTLTLTGMNPASDYGILENATPSSGITECILIDAAGTYQLANNLVGAPIDATELVYIDWACIKIDASDVLLDCNGYNITNNGTLNAGAIVTNATSTLDYTNITLQNCPAISDYEIGVYSQYMNSSVIRNLTVHNSTDGVQGFGFLMSYSVDTNISDNEISDSGSYGIRLRTGQRNRITNNIIYGSGYTGFEIGSTNGYVINNTAHSNDADGYNFISGGYNLIENNLAYNHSRTGFDTNTDNSLFLNNTAYDNVRDGFSIGGSYYTNFTNCTASGSQRYGLYTSEADEIRLENFHFYDNGYDLYWDAYGLVEDIYATNLTFDNPVGDFDDYTRIDFNATLDASGGDRTVSFNWTTNSSALPTNYTSFAQKFVNITNYTTEVSFDEIAWRWSDSELGFIYDESSFELWKWNGSWSDTGATLNTGENSLSLTNMNPASDYGILQNGSIGENATLYAAEVNETKHERYNESSYAGNASTAGGNFTNMNLSAGQLSERWAALYGTFDGSILLSDTAGINNVYSWIWNASAGGVVCVSTNDSLFTFTVFPAEASDIDTAWSFSPTAADSANNTFTQSNCTLDIGTTSVPNASYADTGLEGGYITCAIKTTLSPVKSNLAFCAEIEEDGPIWNGDSGDFEIIVPTPSGVGTTETYYFYVNLD